MAAQTLITASPPAPVGGWNARDALPDMKPTDAWLMDNFFPSTTTVDLRKGYSNHVTGIGGQVESLLPYNSITGTQKLFGCANNAIYDVSTAGAVGTAAVTGLTNNRRDSINITNSAGTSFLLSVNGADKLRGYDGSAWYTDGDGSHDITGVDTAAIIGLGLHKTRVMMVQTNTLKFWYLAANAISGAANSFDLASIAKYGGYLMAIGTWTIDAGYGVDDLFVAVTSEGEIIVYRGTDISSSNTWALVGVWKIGAPLGRRCLLKYEGDLLILSRDGLIPMSEVLQSSRVRPIVAVSDKIRNAMSDAATLYSTNFGWQTIHYAPADLLLVNVPVLSGYSQQQYVMNTVSPKKPWARWKAISANCWAISNEKLYFGGLGFVGRAWNTAADASSTIVADVGQAYSDFKYPSRWKQFTMARPIFLTNGAPNVLLNINVDFNDVPVSTTLPTWSIPWATWDSGVWDLGLWGSDFATVSQWQGVNGVGKYGSLRMSVSSSTVTLQWVSTDIVAILPKMEGVI